MSRIPRGFTLIELLIAITLGMIVVMVAGKGFHDASVASSNAMNSIQMHQEVRQFFRLFDEDVANMVSTSQIYVDNTSGSGKVGFLSQMSDLDVDYDGDADYSTPLQWVLYDQDPSDEYLYRTVVQGEGSGDYPNPQMDPADISANATSSGVILKEVQSFDISALTPQGTDTSGTIDGLSPRGASSPASATATWPVILRVTLTLENRNIAPKNGQTIYTRTFVHDVRVPGSK